VVVVSKTVRPDSAGALVTLVPVALEAFREYNVPLVSPRHRRERPN
jgi:hypothetical protein